MADEGTGRRAANGAHGAAKDSVAGYTADHGAYTGAHLGARRIGSATTQSKGCSAGGGEKDVTDFHGKSPL
ncbi:hypothetical protein D3C72_2468400 [compost metagenome]